MNVLNSWCSVSLSFIRKMNFLSNIVCLFIILLATLVLTVTPQNYESQKSCNMLSAVHRDQNGIYGSITIPDPDYQNIVIKAIYSVAARLPSVRFQVSVSVVINSFST